MRIYGYFDERYDPPAPFIRTTLTSRTLKLESKHMLSYLNRNIQRMLKTTFFQKKSSHKNVGNNTKCPSCSTRCPQIDCQLPTNKFMGFLCHDADELSFLQNSSLRIIFTISPTTSITVFSSAELGVGSFDTCL